MPAIATAIVVRKFIEQSHGRIGNAHSGITYAQLTVGRKEHRCRFEALSERLVLADVTVVDDFTARQMVLFHRAYHARHGNTPLVEWVKFPGKEGIHFQMPILLAGSESDRLTILHAWYLEAAVQLMKLDLIVDMVRSGISQEEAEERQERFAHLETVVGRA